MVADQPGKRSGVILPVLMNQRKAVSVAIETRVPASTQAEARSTPISYCVAMTKMLSAGGSAAMTIAAYVQVGSKSPERREQHPDEERVQDELDRDERRHLAGHAQDRPQRHGDAEEEERAGRRRLRQPGHDLVDRGRRLEPQIGGSDPDHGGDIEGVGRDLPGDVAGGRGERALLGAGDRHQERHEREQEQVVEDENQHDGRAGAGSERRQH